MMDQWGMMHDVEVHSSSADTPKDQHDANHLSVQTLIMERNIRSAQQPSGAIIWVTLGLCFCACWSTSSRCSVVQHSNASRLSTEGELSTESTKLLGHAQLKQNEIRMANCNRKRCLGKLAQTMTSCHSLGPTA